MRERVLRDVAGYHEGVYQRVTVLSMGIFCRDEKAKRFSDFVDSNVVITRQIWES